MSKRKVVWWKILVGFLIVYGDAKAALFPDDPAFLQPSNPDQAVGMKIAMLLIGGLGIFFLFWGLIGERAKQDATTVEINADFDDSRVKPTDAPPQGPNL
jgi:hypothetical protein